MKLSRHQVLQASTIVAAIVAVVLLREILLPFIAGAGLAYLFNPLASRLEQLGMSRLLATLTIVGIFVCFLASLILLIAPLLIDMTIDFFSRLPGYLEQLQNLATSSERPWLAKIFGEGLGYSKQSIGQLTTLATAALNDFLVSAWSGGRALLNIFSICVVTPLIAFYLIYYWKNIIITLDKLLPSKDREAFYGLARQIDAILGGFVRGQAAICSILGLYYGIALSITGLNHAILIALVAAVISFIPYLGMLITLSVSTCIAIAQFWPHWERIIIIPVIFIFGQLVVDYVLSPYLVGQRLNLNPVWTIFALFACGYLFGFVGLLIAVPLAATIGAIVRSIWTENR